jgi:uncharacterized membrane protein YsdA (DUF1294 family)
MGYTHFNVSGGFSLFLLVRLYPCLDRPSLLNCKYCVLLPLCKDKKAAQTGMWRVPEKRLHLATLLFGWPGSIIAQQKLRHKTQKLRFRIVFFIMLSLNLGLVLWLHSPVGSQKLNNTIYRVEYWVVNQFGSNVAVTVFLKLTQFHLVK